MKVYLLKDVEKVGMAGQVITVSDGYATNFLFPRKLAKEVTSNEDKFFANKAVKVQVATEVLNNKISMLAERVKTIKVTIKRKAHDNGKLYGSVGQDDVVELLKEKEIVVNRKQVEIEKAIRTIGDHQVCIRFSSKLRPAFTLKVIEEKSA